MNSGQLPSLQLNLGDISSKLRNLGGSRASLRTSRADDGRAQYLLAASGVPRGATRRDLDAFGAQDGNESTSQSVLNDTSMETYMASLHAKTAKDLMQESLEQSKRDFDAFVEDKIQINWDQQRRRVYEHFGLARANDESDDDSNGDTNGTARGGFGRSARRSARTGTLSRGGAGMSFGTSGMSRSVLGGSIGKGSSRTSLFTDVADKTAANGLQSALDDPWQRTKQEKYAAKVKELNSSRLRQVVYPVIEQFAHVEVEGGSDVSDFGRCI